MIYWDKESKAMYDSRDSKKSKLAHEHTFRDCSTERLYLFCDDQFFIEEEDSNGEQVEIRKIDAIAANEWLMDLGTQEAYDVCEKLFGVLPRPRDAGGPLWKKMKN